MRKIKKFFRRLKLLIEMSKGNRVIMSCYEPEYLYFRALAIECEWARLITEAKLVKQNDHFAQSEDSYDDSEYKIHKINEIADKIGANKV